MHFIDLALALIAGAVVAATLEALLRGLLDLARRILRL